MIHVVINIYVVVVYIDTAEYCISILDTAADVTEGDTSQDVLTSYPHTLPSGMCELRTVYIAQNF